MGLSGGKRHFLLVEFDSVGTQTFWGDEKILF